MSPGFIGLLAFAGLLGMIYALIAKDLMREALVATWGLMGVCCLWLMGRLLLS